MSFLSPAFLLAAAAVGVPIWLHLARRRKLVPVPFSSLRYLKIASARMRRQARLEDIGLLVLRALLVLVLALALARPVLDSRHSFFGLARPREVVVVVDGTASMRWSGPEGSRLAKAKQQATAWIGQLGDNDRAAVWVLTDRLEKPVPEPTGDRRLVLDAIAAIQPGDGSASLAGVFAAARDWAGAPSPGTRTLAIFTDNQPVAWDWPAGAFFSHSWPRDEVEVLVVQTDDARPANLALRSVEWPSAQARPGRVLQGVAKVENLSAQPAADILEVSADGKPITRQAVSLDANGTVDVPISLPVPAEAGAIVSGEAALAGDAMPSDDRWFFAVPAMRTVSAVVVEKASGLVGRVRPSFFLARALAAGKAAKVEVVDSGAWPTHPLDGVDAVFACGGAWGTEADWTKARAFAAAGGTVAVFADNAGDTPPAWWPVAGGQAMPLPPGRIATKLLAPGHPLFAGVWGEGLAAFPPLAQGTAWQATVVPGASVLATLAGELPLFVELPIGQGRLLWLNTSADRAWGDFPLSPVYLVMMQQTARLGDLAARAPTQRWVGDGWPALRSDQVTWSSANSATALPRAQFSGLHSARDQAGGIVWQCAVNVRRDESDLRPVDPTGLAALLPGRVVTGTAGMEAQNREAKRQVPLWPWLLALATGIFLAESLWSARAARHRQPSPPA